jgi:hypothetical protein
MILLGSEGRGSITPNGQHVDVNLIFKLGEFQPQALGFFDTLFIATVSLILRFNPSDLVEIPRSMP